MQHVIVQTKLQSIIIKHLFDEGVVKHPFHLIHFPHSSEPSTAPYISELVDVADKVTEKARPKHGFFSFFSYFLWLMARCRLLGESIFLANVNWYHFGLALRIFPGVRLITFDDGTANIQTDSVYFTNHTLDLNTFIGKLAHIIFPYGVAGFVRSKIDTHYTIYPGLKNIVDSSKIVGLQIKWNDLIERDDRIRLPAHVERILVGTVYSEASEFCRIELSDKIIQQAIAWSDLYLPHPRQNHNAALDGVASRYSAESLISYYSTINKIVVAHFNSSAVIPFASDPRVELIDLSKREDLP